eukprot:scaffold44270_cov31-Prasinocladus_malaysianus.AAC.1
MLSQAVLRGSDGEEQQPVGTQADASRGARRRVPPQVRLPPGPRLPRLVDSRLERQQQGRVRGLLRPQ